MRSTNVVNFKCGRLPNVVKKWAAVKIKQIHHLSPPSIVWEGKHRHSNGEIDSFIRRLMMKVLEVREIWAGLALEICPHAVAAKQQQQSQPRPVHQHHILYCSSPTHLTLLSFNTLHIALCTLRCKQRLSHCTGNR